MMRRVVERRAEPVVLEHHHDAITVSIEAHDLVLAACTAIEADGVRAEPGRETDPEQRASRCPRKLGVEPALFLVEVERNEAVAFLEAGDLRCDGRLRRLRGWRI